jgi:hypothetical protein
MAMVTANDLPTDKIKSIVCIHPFITGGWMNRREQQKGMK